MNGNSRSVEQLSAPAPAPTTNFSPFGPEDSVPTQQPITLSISANHAQGARTLEEIEEVFNQGHQFSAWAISRDVGKKNLQDVLKDTEEKESIEKHDA